MADKVKVTLLNLQSVLFLSKKNCEALGLTKIHKTVELPDNACYRGMIQQVAPYVKVEEV